jgi:hypothetical protein
MTIEQTVARTTPAEHLMRAQASFCELARAPRVPDNEQGLFEPDAQTLVTLHALQEMGAPAEYCYAFMETGLLLTEDNQTLLSTKDLEQWDRAIERFHQLSSAPFSSDRSTALEDVQALHLLDRRPRS